MSRAAKQGRSLRVTAAKAKKMQAALDELEAHVSAAAESWNALTPAQRDALLAHSPVLSRFLDLARRF